MSTTRTDPIEIARIKMLLPEAASDEGRLRPVEREARPRCAARGVVPRVVLSAEVTGGRLSGAPGAARHPVFTTSERLSEAQLVTVGIRDVEVSLAP